MLCICSLKILKESPADLCLKCAEKCTKNVKTRDMFPLMGTISLKPFELRHQDKYLVTPANTAKSAIPYMQCLLNSKQYILLANMSITCKL